MRRSLALLLGPLVLFGCRGAPLSSAPFDLASHVGDGAVGQAPRAPETGMALDAAISALPTGARTVFVMHDVEGYRHEEIARMTGLAEGTSKSQLHRARKLLKEMLT